MWEGKKQIKEEDVNLDVRTCTNVCCPPQSQTAHSRKVLSLCSQLPSIYAAVTEWNLKTAEVPRQKRHAGSVNNKSCHSPASNITKGGATYNKVCCQKKEASLEDPSQCSTVQAKRCVHREKRRKKKKKKRFAFFALEKSQRLVMRTCCTALTLPS